MMLSPKNIQSLLPRRAEIFGIIHDHPYSSFDSIVRRFLATPKRTLANDVHWLVLHGFVVKHGSTRGARYSSIEQTNSTPFPTYDAT